MRITRIALLPAAAALLLAACGGASDAVADDPAQTLEAAMDRMAAWDGVSLDGRLVTTADSLLALDEDGELDRATAELLANTQGSLDAHPGNDPESPDDDRASVRLQLGDLEAMEMISSAGEIYVRSELDEMARALGDPQSNAEYQASMDQLATAGFGFVDALRSGQWIHLRGAQELASMAEGMAGGTATGPDASGTDADRDQLQDRIDRFVEEDVTVTYAGTDEVGDHLVVEASGDDVAALYLDIMDVATAAGSATGVAPQTKQLDDLRAELEQGDTREELAAVTVPVDVWLADGELSRVAVDLVEMAAASAEGDELPAGVEQLGVVTDLAPFDGDVEVPEDPVEVDIGQLLGQFLGEGLGSEMPFGMGTGTGMLDAAA